MLEGCFGRGSAKDGEVGSRGRAELLDGELTNYRWRLSAHHVPSPVCITIYSSQPSCDMGGLIPILTEDTESLDN